MGAAALILSCMVFALPVNGQGSTNAAITRFLKVMDGYGHVSYTKIYWKTEWPIMSCAGDHDPPDGYDYQWNGN
jgi:hypothetical protein